MLQHKFFCEYGALTRVVEKTLADNKATYGLNDVCFSISDADALSELSSFHQPERSISVLFLVSVDSKRHVLTIWSINYGMPDCVCFCYFMYVCNLVPAHVLRLKRLNGYSCRLIFNLSIRGGFFVWKVVIWSFRRPIKLTSKWVLSNCFVWRIMVNLESVFEILNYL